MCADCLPRRQWCDICDLRGRIHELAWEIGEHDLNVKDSARCLCGWLLSADAPLSALHAHVAERVLAFVGADPRPGLIEAIAAETIAHDMSNLDADRCDCGEPIDSGDGMGWRYEIHTADSIIRLIESWEEADDE